MLCVDVTDEIRERVLMRVVLWRNKNQLLNDDGDLCELLLMLYLDNARGAHLAQPSPKVEIPVRECPPYIPPPARVSIVYK